MSLELVHEPFSKTKIASLFSDLRVGHALEQHDDAPHGHHMPGPRGRGLRTRLGRGEFVNHPGRVQVQGPMVSETL